ncbi:Nitrogen regulation protein NtrC [Labilithrix luteola]|uniref:Nitrogen regulation protein NtrC n=1 Tax=Labilithrix luteola TaxID=1391654 RepID=A0A0K1Q2X1_9BACT|nr:Nitrogen regulation protein NtrC [Labilithrix luteola]
MFSPSNGPANEVRPNEVRPNEEDRPSTATSQTLEIAIVPRTGGWALEIQDAAGGRRVVLGRTPVVVGSSARAGIVIEDATVSARHCEIAVHGAWILVRDLGSTNGTYVGGARIHEAWGTEGTTIAVGQSTLVCVAHEENDDDGEEDEPLPGVAGESRPMRILAGQVRRLAKLSAPVLVNGETGVGKELIVRALHAEGPRAGGPFVAMNVSALPRELVESELFGHERGAFTGAVNRRAGAFAEAEGGTLFLDEIGELPIDAQPKLLRALDGYEVRRIGAAGSGRKANARVVTATHVRLSDSVERGAFRRDLFHRLEVFVVEIPPLRERQGDIVPIARAILAQMEPDFGLLEMTPAAIGQLTAHDWPGNVRELRAVLQRAADYARGRSRLEAALIERALRKTRRTPVAYDAEAARQCLERHGGNVSAAARAANVPRTTFRKLLTEGAGPKKA